MSQKIVSAVMQRYPSGRNERMVALAVASVASDDGQHIETTVAHLASLCRISPRAVQRQLRAMLASGWLILVAGSRGPGLPNEYRINPEWIAGGKVVEDLPQPIETGHARRSNPARACDHEAVGFDRLRKRLSDYNRELLRIRRYPAATTHFVVRCDFDVPHSYTALSGVQRHLDRLAGRFFVGGAR